MPTLCILSIDSDENVDHVFGGKFAVLAFLKLHCIQESEMLKVVIVDLSVCCKHDDDNWLSHILSRVDYCIDSRSFVVLRLA